MPGSAGLARGSRRPFRETRGEAFESGTKIVETLGARVSDAAHLGNLTL